MTDPNYWNGRWERGETGWHQSQVEPNLVLHFGSLEPTRVFVPLCGKSLDLLWLARQVHEVVGVELSELPCRAFFEENQIPFTETRKGEFKVFRGGGITIYQGDFFALTPEHLGKLGAVYDRAALIALPPDVRTRYAARLTGLIRACALPGFQLLEIAIEGVPPEGPPFPVTAKELERLYGREFEIECLSLEPVTLGGANAGMKADEAVYRLKLRQP